MSESLRIEGLLVKEESAYGTDPTPTPADNGVRGVGRIWTAMTSEYVFPNRREEVVSNSLIKAPPGPPTGRVMSLEYTVQLMGAGAPYSSATPVRPECDPLLVSSAMSRTHDDTGSAEKVTYAFADSGHLSCTIWAYAGKKLFKLVGCRGTWTWSPQAGGLGQITFRMQGMLASSANSTVPSITYDSVMPPAAVGMGLAVVPNGGGSWTPKFSGMEIQAGVSIERMDDANAADGIEGFEVSEIAPVVSFQPRVVDLSTYDPYAHRAAPTDHTIDMTLGATQYNRVGLDVNAAYLMTDPGFAEENGFAAYAAEYECQDFALVFS